MNNKKKKFLIFLIILGLGLFIGYIHEYQQILSEGLYLSDEHCIKVNPLVIDRKNKYLVEYKLTLSGTGSSEEYKASLDNYLQASQAYMKEEKVWLEEEKRYIDGKAFNLVIPSHIKEALKYQYQMYEAEYNSSYYISQVFIEPDQQKQLALGDKIARETVKNKEASTKYNELLNQYGGKITWIDSFVKAQAPKCPPENNNIPQVQDPFASPIPVTNGVTKG